MTRKIFDPEKYGMVICPSCDSLGFIQNPKRQCCPKCGGFGFIIKEAGQDMDTSKYKIMSPAVMKGGT
jgi:DnaJ-class molecular chaperone